MISIIVPSRGRPEMFSQMLDSLYNMALGRVEVLLYTDKDDLKVDRYDGSDVEHHLSGDFIDMGEAQNALYALSSGSIIMPGNDDQLYKTKGWDIMIRDRVNNAFPDSIYVAWVNDCSPKAPVRCAFPIVSRKWVDTLGYFIPEGFHYLYRDTWLHDIAKRIGREVYISNVYTEHLHPCFGKSEKDDTFMRPRSDKRNAQDDKQRYDNTEKERAEDAARLRLLMNND